MRETDKTVRTASKLAKQSEMPVFLVDQFKVVIKGMNGELTLLTDEEFAGVDEP